MARETPSVEPRRVFFLKQGGVGRQETKHNGNDKDFWRPNFYIE